MCNYRGNIYSTNVGIIFPKANITCTAWRISAITAKPLIMRPQTNEVVVVFCARQTHELFDQLFEYEY